MSRQRPVHPEEISRPTTVSSSTRIPRSYHWSLRPIILTSKPVILILVWIFVISGVFLGVQYTGSLALISVSGNGYDPITKLSFIYVTGFYAFMTIVNLTYPLGGFIADVYCGRYRMVTASMGFIWTALFIACIAIVLYVIAHKFTDVGVPVIIVASIAFCVAVPGLSGFYSNVMQLSLDQLQDAPSSTLGVYLHWSVWVDLLGQTVVHIVFIMVPCTRKHPGINKLVLNVAYILPGVFFTLLTIVVSVNCCTKRWFYTEAVRYNPYKMVLNVLRFAQTHKYPARQRALYWNNDRQPSRIDFAKDSYGGPFTIENVEDVKTFGRVLGVLSAIGPVFVLCVPTSYYIFPLYSFHLAGKMNTECTWEWVLLKSGTLSYIIALVTLPVIMWVVYGVLRNRVPKILTRLAIGIVLFILSILSMFLTDLIGHSLQADTHTNMTQCMFLESYALDNNNEMFFDLNLPWYAFLVPNCLTMLSYSIILATCFEFVSAQSPQSMKGVLFGLLFAIKGGYNFIGAFLLVPFSLPYWKEVHTVLNCGSAYFLLMLLISIVGMVTFVCVSRRYKYRTREEEPFPRHIVEEIYERRISHPDYNGYDESLIIQDRHSDISPEDEYYGSHSGIHGDGSRWMKSSINEGRGVTLCEEEEDCDRSEERLFPVAHEGYGTFDCRDNRDK